VPLSPSVTGSTTLTGAPTSSVPVEHPTTQQLVRFENDPVRQWSRRVRQLHGWGGRTVTRKLLFELSWKPEIEGMRTKVVLSGKMSQANLR